MKQITVEKVTKIYRMGEKEIYAVREVSFEVEKSEFIILFGPSGSGKTTLLMLLGALIKPSEGRIIYDGQDITRFSEDEAAEWRQKNIG
ncbi:MAG: ATP-binding cassette domain-containing protein, partial [Candidatus Asgardarchaeia archaeon]